MSKSIIFALMTAIAALLMLPTFIRGSYRWIADSLKRTHYQVTENRRLVKRLANKDRRQALRDSEIPQDTHNPGFREASK